MPAGHALDGFFQVGCDVRVVQNCLRVNADVVVDDEFQPRQAHALVGDLAEVKSQLRVAHVHHDLDVDRRHFAALHFSDFGFQQAVIDMAGVALGATDRDQHAVF